MSDRSPSLRAVEVDLATNTLRLLLADETGAPRRDVSRRATLDVGTGGRLIGVELGEEYIDVMSPEPGTESLIRSSDVDVTVEMGERNDTIAALVIPRNGTGYEITYPSGNQ